MVMLGSTLICAASQQVEDGEVIHHSNKMLEQPRSKPLLAGLTSKHPTTPCVPG